MSTLTGLVSDLFDPRYRKYEVATAGFVLQVLDWVLPVTHGNAKEYVSLAVALLTALGVKAIANVGAAPTLAR